MFELVLKPQLDTFTIFNEKENRIQVKYSALIENLKKCGPEKLTLLLAHNLHTYFEKMKPLFEKTIMTPSFMTIDTKKDAMILGKLMKSDITLEIMLLADGTRTLSELAKKLNKQISNISAYVNQLKKEGLLSNDGNGKIKRSIKGIKLNFENGLK